MPQYDLGRKMDTTVQEAPSGGQKEIYYPSISVSTEKIEGLELKIGEKVKCLGVVSGRDESQKTDKTKITRYEIDIKQLNKGYSEEDYLSKSEDEKDKIDEEVVKDNE